MYRWILIFLIALMLPATAQIQEAGGGAGETNVLSDSGTYNGTTGFGLAAGKTGVALKVKGLIEGSNISITLSGDSALVITASGGSGVWTERSDTLFAVDADGDTVAVFWDDDAGNVRWQTGIEDQTLRILVDSLFSTLITMPDDGWIGLGSGAGRIVFDDLATDEVNIMGAKVGIGIANPSSITHIKGNTPGTIGSHPAGQIIIQNPTDNVWSNAVITGYESDAGGNPDQQLWYLGSSSAGSSDITFLNRRSSNLHLGTNGTTRMTIYSGGNVGISDDLDITGTITAPNLILNTDANIAADAVKDSSIANDITIDHAAETDSAGKALFAQQDADGDTINVSAYQPLEATLTDIADGIIDENLDNTISPWAANEIVSTVIHNDEMDASSELLAIMDDETGSASGTPLLVFNVAPDFTLVPTFDSAQFDGNVDIDSIDVNGAANFGSDITVNGKTITGDKYWMFDLVDPDALYAIDHEISIDPRTSAAITVTRIDITLDADPTTELDFDLKFADAFIGLANATVIDELNTTNGTTVITGGFDDATVPANKCVYILFNADPDDAITQVSVKVTWDYD